MRVSADDVTQALWGAPASDCDPDGSRLGLHPDPEGPCARECPYTGAILRGWPVRRMTGQEPVTLTDDGRVLTLHAESWVQDRIGHRVTGRERRRLLALIGADTAVEKKA